MGRFIWQIQSSFYHLFRANPISIQILRKENEAIKILLKSLPTNHIRTGLDIGSGRGNSLELIPIGEAYWIALDYSRRMIRSCRKEFKKVRFVLGDAREMPFITESFDLVLCIGVSEYLEDLNQFLKEIGYLLKPSAFVILTLAPPNFLNFLRWMIGHRIYPIRDATFVKGLSNIPLTILQSHKTLLQHQYLLRKEVEK